MEIDVLYKIPKDLCWQAIKEVAKPNSIGMIYYRACPDPFVTSKTILNSLTRLTDYGFMVVDCPLCAVQVVLNALDKTNYKYSTVPAIGKENWSVFFFIYRSETLKPKHGRLIRMDNWDDVAYLLVHLTRLDDVIMTIGDWATVLVPAIKRLGRGVIAMGADPIFCACAINEGLREESLL